MDQSAKVDALGDPAAPRRERPAGPRLEEQLRHAQKMDAIGQITGGIAHDFNNLLLAISLNVESLAEEYRATASSQPLFDGARQAIEQARNLIRQLLVFARRQPLNPTHFDINQVVLEARRMLRRTMPANIEIETSLGADIGHVFADRNQFETALLNLAVNARDAMPDGGRLAIVTASAVLGAENDPANPGTAPGSYAMVAVGDSGAGMSRAVAERAFEPFYSTKSASGHSGMGLSQVYGYAKQSGGHATIDSTPGRGATVRLLLPCSREPASVRHESALPPARARGETVLLVEDTPLVRDAVSRMLGDLGYTVLATDGAEEALAMLESHSRIDLLFTDMVLPGGIDGEELALVARRLRPGMRVLFTSGYSEMQLRDPAGENAGCSLLAKPYTKAELAAQLRTLFDPETVAGRSRLSESAN